MEDKDQWVGVAPCVRAGIRSLLRRFEDQQAALDEAAKSQAALLNAHARSEARCEALETLELPGLLLELVDCKARNAFSKRTRIGPCGNAGSSSAARREAAPSSAGILGNNAPL